jgi:hypothetical protein
MRLSGYSIKIQYRTQGRYCSSSPLLARPDGEISASCPLEKSPVAWKARQSKHDRGQPEISLIAIIDLPRVVSTDTLRIVMNLACAEPDKGWGQRPCEGIAPSICSCVSGRTVAARRARPGPGAAWKGSNVADRIAHLHWRKSSYGGQRCCWSGPRSSSNARRQSSLPATASQTTVSAAISLDHRRYHLAGLGPVDVLVGVSDDPFTALRVKDG